jgi:hypothetical protein
MQSIKLTQNQVALVDDKDFDKVNQYKWFAWFDKKNNTYQARHSIYISKGKYKVILMHRLIINAKKGLEVDHKNHNGLDNRRSNLRICTRKQNSRNSKKACKSSAKYKGVYLIKSTNKFGAQICVNNKRTYLGSFNTEEDAALVYNCAAQKLFGKFAYLNILG